MGAMATLRLAKISVSRRYPFEFESTIGALFKLPTLSGRKTSELCIIFSYCFGHTRRGLPIHERGRASMLPLAAAP